MNKEPLVSVFLPYYNDEKYIKEAIEAVLNQSYKNWELFLFNHSSTDNSRTIARSFNDPRIIHIDAKRNLGAGSGYNIKITLPLMKGKYVKLCCADDMLKENGLETLVNYMEENPEKDMVFSDMDYVSEELKDLNTKWSEDIPKVDFVSNEAETLLKFFKGWSHLAYPTSFVKLSMLKDIDIDVSFIMLFDVALWVSALIAGKKIGFIDKSTVNYRISSNQLSSVNNMTKAVKIGYFELFQLLPLYYKIKDVKLIKTLCPCKFSEMLNDDDTEFIPFIISYFFASCVFNDNIEYFKDQQSVREVFGNMKLHEIFQDDELREKIYNKFGFGIKEFREIYSFIYRPKQNWKLHIYNKQAKDLSVLQSFYILLRKIIPRIRIKHKKKNNTENDKKHKFTV